MKDNEEIEKIEKTVRIVYYSLSVCVCVCVFVWVIFAYYCV